VKQGKISEKAEFMYMNEHFEPVFNTASTTQIDFQQPVREVPELSL